MSEDNLLACETSLGYTFKDRWWLHKALVHSSNRISTGISNERLEFVGDSVLGMIISEYLFREFPNFTEGQLTKVKSVVVSRSVLARAARATGLDKCISVGPGMTTDPLPETVMADCFEAVIAALYIDGGIEAARKFVLERLENEVDAVIEDRHEKNYKSLLQQLVQRKQGITPTYKILDERGPDHVKQFCVAAVLGDRISDSAWGPSKRAAEQLAAEKAYRHLIEIYGTAEDS